MKRSLTLNVICILYQNIRVHNADCGLNNLLFVLTFFFIVLFVCQFCFVWHKNSP